MPSHTIVELPADEQASLLRELRQNRYGYFLGLHILLLCAQGRTPSEIAAFLFCSRSSVYRTVKSYRQGRFPVTPQEEEQPLLVRLLPWERWLLSLLGQVPRVFGWCRTRWSCATLALELQMRRGYGLSRETIRRTLHRLGYVWKRARPRARDNDPERVLRLARIRFLIETLPAKAALFFADEMDIHLLPKIGCEWMRQGAQKEIDTPGINQKSHLAGALDYRTGELLHVIGERKDRFLFLNLLEEIERACPAHRFTRIYVVVDNFKIHKARAVEQWLERHPRLQLVWLPNYCPQANPIERAFADVHDKCTRNHQRKCLGDLIGDVLAHLQVNGPWRYKLSRIYYTPEITQAVSELSNPIYSLAA